MTRSLPPRRAHRPNGHRYVRVYRLVDGTPRWALWEIIDGRARRVGTATTEAVYRTFLAAKP